MNNVLMLVYSRYQAANKIVDEVYNLLEGTWNEAEYRGTKDGDFLQEVWSFLGETSDTLDTNMAKLRKLAGIEE